MSEGSACTRDAELLHRDLFGLGFQKCIGYLPCGFLEKMSLDIEDVMRQLTAIGLLVNLVPEHKCGVFRGAVYACHKEALDSLISQNKTIVEQAGWPTDAKLFFEMVGERWISEDSNPKLYAVIGKAFGNARFVENDEA